MIENPSGPDPDAVQRALDRVSDYRCALKERGYSVREYVETVMGSQREIEAAARAWLAQQDGEASE